MMMMTSGSDEIPRANGIETAVHIKRRGAVVDEERERIYLALLFRLKKFPGLVKINEAKTSPKTTQTTSKLLPNYLQATSWRRLLASRCHSYWSSSTNGIWGDFWRQIAKSTRQKCIPYSTSATWTPQNCIPYSTLLFRGCKSAIRYCKVLFRGAKSAIRYAKTQNDLSPLWGRSDLGSLKHNTYATFFLTLHSLWGPSDFFFAKVPPVEVYRLRRHSLVLLRFAWLALARLGLGLGTYLPIAPES